MCGISRASMHVLFSFVLVCMCSAGSNLKCYKCTSTELPHECGSDFRLTPSNQSHVAEGCESCSQVVLKIHDGEKVYIRECFKSPPGTLSWRSGCSSKQEHGRTAVEECFCNDNLCNTATSGYIDAALVMILLASVQIVV